LNLGDILPAVQTASDKGLLAIDQRQIRATALGWRYLNELQAIFLQ
jgi:hypothetical protein